MNYFVQVKKWIGEITEIALLLIALGVAVEVLFGSQVPFLSGVVSKAEKVRSGIDIPSKYSGSNSLLVINVNDSFESPSTDSS